MSGVRDQDMEARMRRAERYRGKAAAWITMLEDVPEDHDYSVTEIALIVLARTHLAQLEIELAKEGWRTFR